MVWDCFASLAMTKGMFFKGLIMQTSPKANYTLKNLKLQSIMSHIFVYMPFNKKFKDELLKLF